MMIYPILLKTLYNMVIPKGFETYPPGQHPGNLNHR